MVWAILAQRSAGQRGADMRTAMILAAGEGKRMGALTRTVPKPLLEVANKPLIEHAIASFTSSANKQPAFNKVVINGLYLADQTGKWADGWNKANNLPPVSFIKEPYHLDSGGGVKNALPRLGEEFFVANGDSFFVPSPVAEMEKAWQPHKMDGLVLLCQPERAFGYKEAGDFTLNPNGTVTLSKGKGLAFCGIQILKAQLFKGIGDEVFSLRKIYQQSKRLYGVVYEADWFHVGDASSLAQANERLQAHKRL